MSAQQAPNFTLAHLTTGNQVSLSDYRGRPVVLVFAGRDSGEQAGEISHTIGQRYTYDELPLISILDMRVPKLLQGVVKGMIQRGYQEGVKGATATLQAKGKPVPADMSQVVVMLPDWEGKVAANYGLSGVDKQAVAVLVDGDGYIRGYGTGAQAGQQVLSLFG